MDVEGVEVVGDEAAQGGGYFDGGVEGGLGEGDDTFDGGGGERLEDAGGVAGEVGVGFGGGGRGEQGGGEQKGGGQGEAF